jgi:plasmid stabilization system protein ParE
MRHVVGFTPEAEEQLLALYRYISDAASPAVAARYTSAIVTYCEGLAAPPLRGTRRDDIRPGLRITNYRKRCVVAFIVEGDTVSILGIFYGGRDYESRLRLVIF